MKTYEMTDDTKEFDRYRAFFGTDGLLDKYRNEAERAMRELGEPDFEIYRPKLIDTYFPYSTRTEEQKANPHIALFAIAQNEDNYQYVPTPMRTEKFIEMAFKLNPRVVKFLPHQERTKPEIIKMIAKYKPELLQELGIEYSKQVAETAVKHNPSIYLELNDDWKTNPDIMNSAINRHEDSVVRESYYEQNRAYIKDVLKITIQDLEPAAPKPEQKQERKRQLGPVFTMQKDAKKDKK